MNYYSVYSLGKNALKWNINSCRHKALLFCCPWDPIKCGQSVSLTVRLRQCWVIRINIGTDHGGSWCKVKAYVGMHGNLYHKLS